MCKFELNKSTQCIICGREWTVYDTPDFSNNSKIYTFSTPTIYGDSPIKEIFDLCIMIKHQENYVRGMKADFIIIDDPLSEEEGELR